MESPSGSKSLKTAPTMERGMRERFGRKWHKTRNIQIKNKPPFHPETCSVSPSSPLSTLSSSPGPTPTSTDSTTNVTALGLARAAAFASTCTPGKVRISSSINRDRTMREKLSKKEERCCFRLGKKCRSRAIFCNRRKAVLGWGGRPSLAIEF